MEKQLLKSRLVLKGRRAFAFLLCLLLTVSFCLPTLAATAASDQAEWADKITAMLSAGEYAEGEVIAGVLSSGKAAGAAGLLAEGEEIMDVTEAEEDLLNGKVPDDGEIHIVYLQREDLTTEQILTRLSKDRRVLFAEPNYIAETNEEPDPADEPPSTELETEAEEEPETEEIVNEEPSEEETADGAIEITEDASSDPKSAGSIRTTGIDDLTPLQWSSSDDSTFRLEGNGAHSIHVPNFGPTGSNMEGDPVVVAVLDSALDFTNPDLAPTAYTFTEEQLKALGCDVHGFNANPQAKDGKLIYWDKQIHGTHCAGIIGAAWDGQGISGIASNVKFVSIQICPDNGTTSLVNILRGFDFIDRANALGCNISLTSNSWGLLQESLALDAAVRKLGEKWGTISFFSAGNDNRDIERIGLVNNVVADNPYAVVVSAMDSADIIAPYSNFGKNSVDLGAPGSGILSTINVNDTSDQYFADAVTSTNKFYEGFEGETYHVAVSQTNMKAQLLGETPTVTDQSSFAGSRSLKIKLDPAGAEKGANGRFFYNLILDLGDVSAQGIQGGDYIGLTLGAKGAFGGTSFSYIDPATGQPEMIMGATSGTVHSNGWNNSFVELPQEINTKDLRLVIAFGSVGPLDAVYLDSIGIGTEKVPYEIMDGTSMACPAAVGFAAVLKSQSPETKGTDLVALVKSKVRTNASLADITKTGGTIDFLASQTEGTTEPVLTPSIQNVEVSGTDVKITGANFTNSGKAVVSKIVAGKEPETKGNQVTSWNDSEVLLSLDQEFTGVLQVVLENKDGRSDTFAVFVSKSEDLYEEDLPLEKSTGEPYTFDALGDWETNGPLIGLDNKLYYLPSIAKLEEEFAYRKMRCFDIQTKTWSDLPDLPEYLAYISAVMYDGKIVVKGSTMSIAEDGSPYGADDPVVKVYVYDPASASWSSASAENISLKETLSNLDGQLILVGGGGLEFDETQKMEVTKPGTVKTYDLTSGAGTVLANLTIEMYRPVVACKNGAVYVLDINSYSLEKVEGGQSTVLENALPKYLTSGSSAGGHFTDTERTGILLPVTEGILFVGPTAADGASDTFLLKDGASKFEPYGKRMSDSKVTFPAAASYRGYVYAIGSGVFEDGGRFFRRTAIDVPEYAGDISAKEEAVPAAAPAGTKKTSPKTSDENDPILWIWFMAAALGTGAAAGIVFGVRRKHSR